MIQVYEDTSGLTAGEPVIDTREPLRVELGPGLLGSIFDGTQRPLTVLARAGENPWGRPMIPRGLSAPALDRERRWEFEPAVGVGEPVGAGDMLGTVQETAQFTHRILVPPGVAGTVTDVRSGPARIDDPVVWIDGSPLTMLSRWPVRRPRPAAGRLGLDTPFVTGQRSIDTLFPLARGGTATIPGGFGTGKTVLEQSLAKWGHADVIVYVACGERGNELTEVLDEFPQLTDPRTGASLMERTILVANTSNMPVAAREASIYTGITIAEYFRDQGYHVALMADSTSRWGEALREVSSRLEEMPAEEGYPAYLATRLAEFYERAGAVRLPRPRRALGLGLDRRRRLAGRRRLLRADHAAQPAPRRDVLGARHDARAPAALPVDQLEPQLHALRARRLVRPRGRRRLERPAGLGARPPAARELAARDRAAARHRLARARRARRARERPAAARGLPAAVGVRRRATRTARSASSTRCCA